MGVIKRVGFWGVVVMVGVAGWGGLLFFMLTLLLSTDKERLRTGGRDKLTTTSTASIISIIIIIIVIVVVVIIITFIVPAIATRISAAPGETLPPVKPTGRSCGGRPSARVHKCL